jgi:uncharacterized membrane protein (UPF0127 family)
MMAKLIRIQDQLCIVESVEKAESYWSRLKGLIGRREFVRGQGLLFTRCNSVHMWMMSIPIDVIFLKADAASNGTRWSVSGVHSTLKPWKFFPVADWGADDALELPAGTADALSIRKGDELCIVS